MRENRLTLSSRIFSIIILIAILTPGIGSFVLLRQRRSEIRREVKHQLIASTSREGLELLKFTKDQAKALKWKHSKEFEYRNHMYDVVEKIEKGDSIYFWCWWDYEETILNKKLKTLLADIWQQNPQRKNTQDFLVQFYKSLFHQHINYPENNIQNTELPHNSIYQVDPYLVYLSPPDPPPISFS